MFKKEFDISKIDEDKKVVFAWASVIEENGEILIDKQGDYILEEDLEDAAYGFVLNSRNAGEMHIKKSGVGRLVESIVFTKQKQQALGIDLGKVGWFVGFKIDDDNVWDKIKKGNYPMMSIGGKGIRQDD
jgi:hypothetical protein